LQFEHKFIFHKQQLKNKFKLYLRRFQFLHSATLYFFLDGNGYISLIALSPESMVPVWRLLILLLKAKSETGVKNSFKKKKITLTAQNGQKASRNWIKFRPKSAHICHIMLMQILSRPLLRINPSKSVIIRALNSWRPSFYLETALFILISFLMTTFLFFILFFWKQDNTFCNFDKNFQWRTFFWEARLSHNRSPSKLLLSSTTMPGYVSKNTCNRIRTYAAPTRDRVVNVSDWCGHWFESHSRLFLLTYPRVDLSLWHFIFCF